MRIEDELAVLLQDLPFGHGGDQAAGSFFEGLLVLEVEAADAVGMGFPGEVGDALAVDAHAVSSLLVVVTVTAAVTAVSDPRPWIC